MFINTINLLFGVPECIRNAVRKDINSEILLSHYIRHMKEEIPLKILLISLMTNQAGNRMTQSNSEKLTNTQLFLNPQIHCHLNNSLFCPVKIHIYLRFTSNISYTTALCCDNYKHTLQKATYN
jgi:hypothetical protein